MKTKKIFIFPVILILVGTILVSACSFFSGPAGHYRIGGVAFNYPTSWVVSASDNTSSGLLASISDPKDTSIKVVITKLQLPSGTETQQAQDNLVNSMSPTQILSATAACSLGGIPAYETYFVAKDREIRLTSLQSGGYLYSVTSSASPEIFVKNQTEFDIIVNTFQIE
jgi:hypothetical protein